MPSFPYCYVCARVPHKDNMKCLDHVSGGKPYKGMEHVTFCSEKCMITFLNKMKEEGYFIKLHWKEIKK
jgi:hypothetical protein